MLCILLSLIPLRTVINETSTFEVARLFRHVQAVGVANPGTTFLFALVIALAAAATWIRRLAVGAAPCQRTGAEIGLVILTIAAGVSCSMAGQKHLALIGAANFLTLILYGLTLRQYLTRPWRVRLALIVIAATALVVVAKCAYQHFIETPDTIRYWEEHKAELLGPEASVTSGKAAGMRHDYEMRMRSQLVTGFYPHANVLGSQLILFILAAAALIGDRIFAIRQRRTTPLALILPTLIIATCFVALLGTDSKGAVACAGLGVAIWIVATFLRRQIDSHRRLTALAVWGGAILGVIALGVTLNRNEAAFGKSIQFRSMYWRGAFALIADDHLLGVGPLNFGRHFLRYKPVECPEEVESPHSWPVQLAAEWGVPGLVAFLVILLGLTLRLCRPTHSTLPQPPPEQSESVIYWPAALTGLTFLCWMKQLTGANGGALIDLLIAGATIWFAGAILLSLESARNATYADAPLVGVAPAVIAAILCFLLHTGIDLAMFEGGPATTFFALVAIAIATSGMRATDSGETATIATPPCAAPRRNAAIGVGIITGLIGITFFVQLVARPYACNDALQEGRTDNQPSGWETYVTTAGGVWYQQATEAYTLDGTAPSEFVEQLIPRISSERQATAAMAIVDEFARRDPYNGLHHNTRGTLAAQKYDLTHNEAYLRQAASEYELYVEDYPTSPLRHIYAATMYARLAHELGDMAARDKAVEHLKTALRLDEQRIYVSKPNRLPPEQIEQIQQGIRTLENLSGRL